eukprot:tig00021036_g17390.t1
MRSALRVPRSPPLVAIARRRDMRRGDGTLGARSGRAPAAARSHRCAARAAPPVKAAAPPSPPALAPALANEPLAAPAPAPAPPAEGGRVWEAMRPLVPARKVDLEETGTQTDPEETELTASMSLDGSRLYASIPEAAFVSDQAGGQAGALTRAGRARLWKAGLTDAGEAPPEDEEGAGAVARHPIAALRVMHPSTRGAPALLTCSSRRTIPGRSAYPRVNPTPSVYFTFQFYHYAPVVTEPLMLAKPAASAPPTAPRILVRSAEQENSGGPGLPIKYKVDLLKFARADECRVFAEYLRDKALEIDVWDATSLFLIGTVRIPLKSLMRKHKEAVQITQEFEIVHTPYGPPPEEEDGLSARSTPLRPGGVNATPGPVYKAHGAPQARGRLQLRISNEGHMSEGPRPAKDAEGRPAPVAPRVRSSLAVIPVSRLGTEVPTEPGRVRTHRARPVKESDRELADAIREEESRYADSEGSGVERRPMAREQEIRQRERNLRAIQNWRERRKKQVIQDMLMQSLTTVHTIYPSFGRTCFFEIAFVNPYPHDDCFIISFDDPDLRIVRDTREWRAHKRVRGLTTPLEDDLVSEHNELLVHARETVYVPFVFQSFSCGTLRAAMLGDGAAGGEEATPRVRQERGGEEGPDEPIRPRRTDVSFYNRAGRLVYVVRVHVAPQPFAPDRTFRFHHPENDFFKTRLGIEVTAASTPAEQVLAALDPAGRGYKHVRCSHANVVVRTENGAKRQDVFVKYRCGSWPHVGRFFLLVYHDAAHSFLHEVWQVFVSTLHSMDVSSPVGQTHRASLFIPAAAAPRTVQVHSSNPDLVQVQPSAPFALVPGSVNELSMAYRPLRVGPADVLLHVVDVAVRELVGAWLVETNARPPYVGKTFEVAVPSGIACNKKISFKNPYGERKAFVLRTSHPHLVQFRDTRLDLEPFGAAYIGLRLLPQSVPRVEEVHVFVNDAEDKSEDCLCVRVQYC